MHPFTGGIEQWTVEPFRRAVDTEHFVSNAPSARSRAADTYPRATEELL
jgi:hypothetical protein